MALDTLPGMRTFSHGSALADDGLTLDLAPALTPTGLVDRPGFFHGFAAHPVVVTRSLLVLADIASTRYFRPAPVGVRDPILTAGGDRLRAECFSACNGVLARLDLLASGLDGGQIGHGTTNVDIGPAMRRALARVPRGGLLHLDVGTDRLRASTPAESVEERHVQMPDRWVRALGNAAELTQPLVERFSVGAAGARRFVQTLPRAGATRTDQVWLSAARGQPVMKPHRTPEGVRLMGTHRLAAVARLLAHLEGLTVYAPADGDGATALELALPGARLTLVLTVEPSRGFSGEGSLLTALAAPNVAEDADLISALLAFDPRIDESRLAREASLPEPRVRAALAVLGGSGRVGWDNHEQAWFHRELPHDPSRVERDNPRLVAAQRLVDAGAVTPDGDHWLVAGGEAGYRVQGELPDEGCTCTWYLRHAGSRGPCKHVLATRLITRAEKATETTEKARA